MAKNVKPLKKPASNGPLTSQLLSEHIRAKRTQSGLRLEDAALLCKISKETISKIEAGKSGVKFETVLHVCQMLGLELLIKPWEDEVHE